MTAEWAAEHLIWVDDRDAATPGRPVRLNVLACNECRRCSFPATGTCTWCGSTGAELAVSREGELVAATAVLHPTPGCAVEVPYLVALVRFDSVRLDLLGRLVGTQDVDTLAPGTRIGVVVDRLPDDRLHYAFCTAV